MGTARVDLCIAPFPLQAGQLEQLLREAEQRGDGAAAALASEAKAARAAAAQVRGPVLCMACGCTANG